MNFDKRLRLTDKALLYALPNKKDIMLEYAKKMLEVGVELFEVNVGIAASRCLKKKNLLVRIDGEKSAKIAKRLKVKKVVVDVEEIISEKIPALLLNDFDINAELNISCIDDFSERGVKEVLIKVGRIIISGCRVRTLRLCNVETFLHSSFIKSLYGFLSLHNINIEICCSNKFYMATSVAAESIDMGVKALVGSFSGISTSDENETLFLPIEEIMVYENIKNTKNNQKINQVNNQINNQICLFELSQLQTIKALFEQMTGYKINRLKPIIGKDIFKYEAGIHAAGINKAPETYEPYDPGTVGIKRELCIGKHSGSDAIRQKLIENGVTLSGESLKGILEKVRKRSIEIKGNVCDTELLMLL